MTDPVDQELIDALRDRDGAPPRQRWNDDAAWTRLESRLHTQPAIRAAAPARRPAQWVAVAAGIVIAAGTAYGVIASRLSQRADAFAHDVVTPNGARQTLTLDDGSRVTLNAGSRLRWRADFGARSRDVFLDGEAYFAVTHDASRPFRVHARSAVAHDLGTRFTVRAYRELPHVEVVVAEGSVSIRRAAAADSAILVTGQLGRLGDTGSPTVESNVVLERWTAWTGGSLVLDGLTLAEAVPQLERWYDATIRVSDPTLAARRITTRFHDETLPQMLDALTLALGAKWQQSGRSVTITPVKP